MSKQNIQLDIRQIKLYSVTGELLDGQKWTTTQVYGGGGNAYNNAPVQSSTTTHDQVFIRGDDGQETAAELHDMHLAVRPGHRVSLIWGIHPPRSKGPYLALYNHATGDLHWSKRSINELAGPMFVNLLIIFCVFAAVGGLFSLLGGSSGGLFWLIVGVGPFVWILRRRKQLRAAVEHLALDLKIDGQPASR